MRKGFVKKCLTAGLAFSVAAGLCACGGGGSEADPALAKENVYRLQEIELPQMYEPGNGYMNVLASTHRDGRVQMLINVRDWGAEVYNEYDYRLVSMNEDGSDVQIINLEIPDPDDGEAVSDIPWEEPVEDPAAPEGGEGSGTDEPAEGGEGAGTDEPAEGGEGAGTDEPAEGGEDSEPDESDRIDIGVDIGIDSDYVGNSVWEYTNYNSFSMMADGTVFARKTYRLTDESDPDNIIRKSENSICSWDDQGKLLWDISIGDLDDYTWIHNILEGADNALYVLMEVSNEDYSQTDYYRVRVGMDGSVGEKQKFSDESQRVLFNSDQMIPKGDGTFFVPFHDEDDWGKMYYTFYDVAAGTVGDIREFPSSISYYGVMIPGKTHDLIYTRNDGIYYWDQGNESGQPMMNYINSDLYIEDIYGIVELSGEAFLGFYQEDWDSGVKAGIFTYVKPEDIQDKKVLVIAGNYIDTNMKKRVIEYNRNNPEYRIVLKEYNSYSTYEDYLGGFNRLNSDIISGNMPDILINYDYNSLPISNYISKGLIANIDKLIAEDEELSKTEFMQNAFDAYRVNGKLYYIVPDFEIYTMIAKKSLVGDRETWTMEDMQQVLAGLGGETKAFSGETTQKGFINMVMRYCGNQFVDVGAGKCAFNTDDFISMLEYAKTLQAEEGENSDEVFWEDYWMNYESQYRQNKTLLLEANFWRFDNLAYTINGRIGEEVSYTGFPTESGNGSYIMSNKTYVLSARSKHLDEAWNFMRYYLTDEYQEEVSYFPVQKEKFYEQSQKATERRKWEYTDENGETQTEYEEMSIWINGEEIPYEPLSQEQLDGLIGFIESVHNPYYYNEEIMNIIDEEIDGFFTGQKPAKDVADVIQRRVQNYVDENS